MAEAQQTKPKCDGPTVDEKRRLLLAYQEGDDWLLVAKHNGIPVTTAHRIVSTGHVDNNPRGGARPQTTKATPDMREAMERYFDKNCQYTLAAIQHLIKIDFNGVHISLQTVR
ncbi:hypothetical protein H310_13623 [Aphanomyces invadans]|uniref:Uncharacterized protein n=1 Tax=Aphanomyces invadans TaxID=157072 RepID=A0A024TDB9_9STRA|nr:hypothetical protein H310_13623 [Aphanomyces invadans]ETV91984.1 hypothetical protein H310_13623 [Aphanomyces invadans]|eukprot:XP_008879408.1 hypothetical protein H310_13623 [Aphanomyces invadans]